jgi:hypothetical protein
MGWDVKDGGRERRGAKSNIPLSKLLFFSISIPLSANLIPISIGMTSNMLSRPRKRYNPVVKE